MSQPPPYDPSQQPSQYPPQYPPQYAQPFGYDLKPPRPTSVTVLAIIGIVWAILWLICTPISALPYIIPSMGKDNPAVQQISASPLLYGWTIGSSAINILLFVLLLAASVGSLALKRWARTGMILYSLVSLLLGVIGAIVTFIWILPITMNGPEMQQLTPQQKQFGMICGGGFGLLITLLILSYPICILIFFRKRQVREAFEGRVAV